MFDVGGSHIASGVFGLSSMDLGGSNQILAPVHGNPEEVFESFSSLAAMSLGNSIPPHGIAVAIPNPFDYDQGVSYMRHKYQLLYGTDLREGLSRHLQCEPQRIHFLNDAAAFLMGELHRGTARGLRRAVGITLGTGVGSAFAVDGDIVVHGAGVPSGGEIWNLPYGNGTVEDAVSTRAIQRMYEQRTGASAEVHEIASLAPESSDARKIFDDFGRELGKVLRQACLGFGPDRIILGGGVARAASLFHRTMREELGDPSVEVCVSNLFDRAPLIGAGVSWMRQHMAERTAEGTAERTNEGGAGGSGLRFDRR